MIGHKVTKNVEIHNDTEVSYISGDGETEGSKRLDIDTNSKFVEIQTLTDGIWQPSSFKTGANSLWVGNNVGVAGIGHHLATESSDGHLHLHAHSEFDSETGLSITDTQIINAYNYTERVVLQTDNSGNWTGTSFDTIIPSMSHTLQQGAYFQTYNTAASEPIRVQAWIGTDDTGTLIFDQYYPASEFPADTEIMIIPTGYLEFDSDVTYMMRLSSDANFSIKTNSAGTFPWFAVNASAILEDNLLQTKPWVDGDTWDSGDYIIDSRKIYICNTTGEQTGTFSSNSSLWDELGVDAEHYWNRTDTTISPTNSGDDLELAGNVTIGDNTTTGGKSLIISDNEDTYIWLQADIDDSGGEDDNPYLKMTQNGGARTALVGITGGSGTDPEGNAYTGAIQNSLLLGTKGGGYVHLGSNNTVGLTVNSSGFTQVHNALGIGVADPSTYLEVYHKDGTTDAIVDMVTFTAEVTGGAAVGLGIGLTFEMEDGSGGGAEEQGSIDVVMTNVTADAENADFVFNLNSTGTITEIMRIAGGDPGVNITGDITANNLSGTNTGDQDLWDRTGTVLSPTTAGDDIELLDGDMHFKVQSSGGMQSLIFYEDVAAGETEKFRMQFRDSGSHGSMSFIGGADMFFESTSQDGIAFEHNGSDAAPIFYLTTTGVNGAYADIYVGNRTPVDNLSPGNSGDLYIRVEDSNSELYQWDDSIAENWRKFSKYNVDGTMNFTGDVAVGGDLSITGGLDIAVTKTAVDITTSGQSIIGVTDTSSPRTINISSADIAVSGRIITVKDESAGAGTNTITIATEGPEYIDGGVVALINESNGSITLYSDGSNLFIISKYK